MTRGDKNFWNSIKPPILALAPMAGFTDAAFRRLCRGYGADVLYSEMVSATALYYAKPGGASASWQLMDFSRRLERPFVVQLFGSRPEHFAKAARLITDKIKPDGLDINFGCPVPKVLKQGAGSALMRNPDLARQVILAVLDNTNLPLSIKVRSQVGSMSCLDFLKALQGLPLAALMIHGRSLSQGFAGPSDWSLAKSARRFFTGKILINGGINSLADARQALKISGADGLGLARGVLGRPWLFEEIKKDKEINLEEKDIRRLAYRHASLNSRLKGETGLIELRKHLVWYVKGLPGASNLRLDLVQASRLAEIKKILLSK